MGNGRPSSGQRGFALCPCSEGWLWFAPSGARGPVWPGRQRCSSRTELSPAGSPSPSIAGPGGGPRGGAGLGAGVESLPGAPAQRHACRSSSPAAAAAAAWAARSRRGGRGHGRAGGDGALRLQPDRGAPARTGQPQNPALRLRRLCAAPHRAPDRGAAVQRPALPGRPGTREVSAAEQGRAADGTGPLQGTRLPERGAVGARRVSRGFCAAASNQGGQEKRWRR